LTAKQEDALDALVRTVVPHVFAPDRHGADLVARVVDRIQHAPGTVRRDLLRALDVLASRTANFVIARSGRFPDIPPADRAAAFESWGRSSLPAARSVYQALRRFVLSTWYATPEARSDLGVKPPLFSRLPDVAWEGPLPGEQSLDSEPVARQPRSVRAVPGAHPEPRTVPDAVTTARNFHGDARLTADVVVIGSGAGGAVAAARLAAAGREVVIVEAGEYLDAPDFTEDEGVLVPRLYAEQAMRTTTDGAFALLQGGVVGGGTTVNWMLSLRPPAEVLAAWAAAGITGWTMDDLAPHLDRVEGEIHARTVPDDAHAPSNLAILNGARRLGWRAAAARINATGCVRAGSCSFGCRYEAKQSALLTFLPAAFAAGARLFANAAVDRIDVIERSHGGAGSPPRKRVTATVRDPLTGTARGSLTIEAPIVVLAAGGVGTPVLLEKSGLGGGGVGRFLRLHPTTAVMGHYPFETYPLAGIPQSAVCDEFLRRDENGFGFWIECPALQPALAAAALPGFGAEHRALMQRLHHTVAFIVLVRDGSGSDASLGSVWVDGGGHTRIRYRMTAADRVNGQYGIEAAARLHLAAGAEVALSLHTPPRSARSEADLGAMRAASVAPNRITWFSAHVNGTCRLGVSPATSGVTPEGERHGVRGLYVCDGSLLPTSLGVNPQVTIMAIASLMAERIAK
jgi:choline dehydrogenase-like flavoprotein